MKKAFALAVLMSAAALGGTAYARPMNPVADSANLNVVYTNPDMRHSDSLLGVPQSVVHPSQATISEAQTDIRQSPALRTALVKESVQLNNVVGINTSAGTTTVYVR